MSALPGCPLPVPEGEQTVCLAHGEGGLLTRRLIRDRIQRVLSNPVLDQLADANQIELGSPRLFCTTDTFVVSPQFFSGGDIGSLAVYGTVNDLLVSGAVPVCLSLGLILEEGLPLTELDRILVSIQSACQECGIYVATGDTKVVPRGQCDRIYINTTGLGRPRDTMPPGPNALRPGDVLLVTGNIAQHGIAILAERENLGLTPGPRSDSKSLAGEVACLLPWFSAVRALRDPTRGGVAAVCQEWAEASRCTLSLDETCLPVSPEARAVCELLGLDPLHIAGEGNMLLGVDSAVAEQIAAALRGAGYTEAAIIGKVRSRDLVPVTVVTSLGHERPLVEPLGAPLPRIC